MPMQPRASEEMVFFWPEGRRRRVLPAPSMWPMICAKPPDVLANAPLSPASF